MADLIKGSFNSSLAAVTVAQDLPLRVSGKGEMIVVNPDGSAIGTSGGGGGGTQYAEDAVHVSGDLGTLALVVRKDTAASLAGTDGDYTVPIVDATGRLYVTLGTLIAGEDLTNNVLKVEERFSYAYIATATTTVVKASAGLLHAITIGETAAGAITVYDNTAGSGTVLAVFKASVAEQTFILDASFGTGCSIVTAAASKLTVSYR